MTANVTRIPGPKIPMLEPNQPLASREWYRFFLNLSALLGGGSGLVVLKYLETYPDLVITGGTATRTVSGGYKIYQFTSTSTFTVRADI